MVRNQLRKRKDQWLSKNEVVRNRKKIYERTSAAMLEPINLVLVERVFKADSKFLTILLGDFGGQILARSEFTQSLDGNFVLRLNAIVVSRISKGKGEDSLLLQVCLVNASEGADDDSNATEEARLKSGVFAR